MKKNYLLMGLLAITNTIAAQNVGIGTTTPESKLHIKGTVDFSQFIIDAHSTQGNTNPLIRLRKNDGTDLMWIHSDDVNNTFIGLQAGGSNNAVGGGIFNSFFGSYAGPGNKTGRANTAIGAIALFNNTIGSYNTAVGVEALYQNLASYNTAIGMSALASNNLGDDNTATGYNSLYANTQGSHNTANGHNALVSNTMGSENTGIGASALLSNKTGSQNTGIGASALFSNSTGNSNTAYGVGALNSNISGNDNTALGNLAGPNTGALSNTTCIGKGATASASNQMVLGDLNVTQFYCYGAFAGTTASAPNLTVLANGQIVRSTSSRRYKKDILPLEINTENIYQLRPVSYNSYTDDIRHFGLIAEEVADVIPELATYSREKDVIKGSINDKLIPDAVQYPLLSVLLLNEVQKHEQTINELKATIAEMKKSEAQMQAGKQQTIIEKQQQQIDALQNDIKELKAMMQSKK